MRWWMWWLCLASAHCGAPASNDMREFAGVLHVHVQREKSVPEHPQAVVASYRVVVSGADFAPIETSFDAGAGSGVVADLPPGPDRTIVVEARNAHDQVVRVGQADDVEIGAGDVTDVAIVLEPVPFFANVLDGAVVFNTRLRPDLVVADGRRAEVWLAQDGAATAWVDAARGAGPWLAESGAPVMALSHAPLAPGEYTLTARDADTQYESTVTIRVLDGFVQRGALFTAAGGVGAHRQLVSTGASAPVLLF